MFKLVVLFALLAIVAAAPSGIITYQSVPSAVSHQSRVDVISGPIIASAYAVPAVQQIHAVHAVPEVIAYEIPSAVSHQSRVDVINKPVITGYSSVPVVSVW